MKNKILSLLTNPLVIALFITILVLNLIPSLYPKFIAEIIKKEKLHTNHLKFYEDLDSDGISEEIDLEKGYENRISVRVRSRDVLIDQWSFDGILQMHQIFFGDYNNDNFREIYLFTLNKNEILFHCLDPYNNKVIIKNRFIDHFYPQKGVNNCTVESFQIFDLNNDGNKEIIFPLHAGFPVYPRKLYSYDFVADSLQSSPTTCISPFDFHLIESENDTSPLISISTAAVGNCDSTVKYSDYFSWLILFDKDLNFSFDPIKIGYYPSGLFIMPYKIDQNQYLIALNIYEGNQKHPCSLSLFDLKGKKIKEKFFNYDQNWKKARIFKFDNSNDKYLIRWNGIIERMDQDFNFYPVNKIAPSSTFPPRKIDCDNDGKNEFIFFHQPLEKLTILQQNLADAVEINLSGSMEILSATMILDKVQTPVLNIRTNSYAYFIEYSRNPLFDIRHLIYGLFYLGIWGFIVLIQKTQSYRTEQKFKAEKEIAELQMKSIKNQIDPHFTLNIINSIGSLFSKHETEKANYVFGKYSKLLRNTILNSDQIFTSLKEEIEYVENYLALEQTRSKNGFDFIVNIDSEIDQNITIPKMLIHSFAENSIKHGIRHLSGFGTIKIEAKKELKHYIVSIADDGIGRDKAKDYSSFSTGKGLKIIDQILELYLRLEKKRITYKINDLIDNSGESKGTEVEIKIPI